MGITIGVLAAVLALGIGMYQSDASAAEPKLSMEQIEAMVKDQYPGTITDVELEKDLNKVVYEVEIEGEGKKYDLTLDGNTGEVLKLEETKLNVQSPTKSPVTVKEKEQDSQENPANDKQDEDDQSEQKETENGVTPRITTQEAIEIALKQFAGKVTSAKLDEDDNQYFYEIEIEAADGSEAEFEIDALTGETIVIDMDYETDSQQEN